MGNWRATFHSTFSFLLKLYMSPFKNFLAITTHHLQQQFIHSPQNSKFSYLIIITLMITITIHHINFLRQPYKYLINSKYFLHLIWCFLKVRLLLCNSKKIESFLLDTRLYQCCDWGRRGFNCSHLFIAYEGNLFLLFSLFFLNYMSIFYSLALNKEEE